MTLTFKIQLRGITKPPVWRRLSIPGSYTFANLHEAIQEAFGWEYEHLYQFNRAPYDGGWAVKDPEAIEAEMHSLFGEMDRESYNAEKVRVIDFLKKKNLSKFVYVYDFGDDWIHDLTLESIDEDASLVHPVCLAGKGACPPEDCGGPYGYEAMKMHFAERNDKEELESYCEWLCLESPDDFDPKAFDLDETNEMLAGL